MTSKKRTEWERVRKSQLSILRISTIVFTVFVLLLLGVIFGPVSSSLKKSELDEFNVQSELLKNQVTSFLYQSKQLALQVPSRTRIRQELVAYLQGKRDLESYVEFTRPKLEDAVHATQWILGVLRFAPDGTPLAGVNLRPEQLPALQFDKETPVVQGLTVTVEDAEAILVMVPILDAGYGLAGYDLVAVSLDPLCRDIAEVYEDFDPTRIVLFSRSGGQFFSAVAHGIDESSLERFLSPLFSSDPAESPASAEGLAFTYNNEKYRGSLFRVAENWYLVVARDTSTLYRYARRQAWIFAGVILVVGIIVLLLNFFALTSLSRRTLAETGELSQMVDEQTEELNLLLREVHHRVKNDMNLIQSYLVLQEDRLNDPQSYQEVLHDAEGLVFSIGTVYDFLYRNNNYSTVELRGYLESLLESEKFGGMKEKLILSTRIAEVHYPRKYALSLGIVVNELITNAIKYGRRGNAPVRISVTLHRRQEAGIVLTVQNDGPVFPEQVVNGEFGFGLSLVESLAVQLGGNMSVSNEPEPHVRLVTGI